MPIKLLKISCVVADESTQVRVSVDEDAVEEYAEAMKSGAKFPPIVVFNEKGDKYFCADGFHRILAALKNNSKSINCDVRKGGKIDALRFALGCNVSHGLRRTNADKRKAVEIACKEFAKMSSRAIAQMCAVSHTLVDEFRPSQLADSASSISENPSKTAETPKRKGLDGKLRSSPPPRESGPPPRAKIPAKPTDGTGLEIPDEIVGFYSRGSEAQELLAHVSTVRATLKRAREFNDPLYREVDFTDSLAKLNQVYVDLERAKPFAVCPKCNGVNISKSCICKGRGFLSEFYWKHNIDEETKKLTGRK